jgi:hypothetical protein
LNRWMQALCTQEQAHYTNTARTRQTLDRIQGASGSTNFKPRRKN